MFCLQCWSANPLVFFLNENAPESSISSRIGTVTPYQSIYIVPPNPPGIEDTLGDKNSSVQIFPRGNDERRSDSSPPPPPPSTTITTRTATGVTESTPPSGHHCGNFAFPPPPPADSKRIGPRRKFLGFSCKSNEYVTSTLLLWLNLKLSYWPHLNLFL